MGKVDREMREALLERTEVFVMDMDGTFYCGEHIIDGAPDFLKAVENCGKRYLFFTNNTSKPPQSYLEKLRRMGCEIAPDHIMSAADVTIHYLKKDYPDQPVYLVGSPEVKAYFQAAGIWLYQPVREGGAAVYEAECPAAVVITFDMTLTYEKLERACTYIRNGAAFLATHLDINCPAPGGFLPDCGAICAAIELSTGKAPKYFGKPFKETVDMVLDQTGVPADQIAFIGDRMYTDIAAGVNHGAMGFLVLSGETRPEDWERGDLTPEPDAVFLSLKEMAECLNHRYHKSNG